ncbi:hypothetical protein HLK59_17795 [Streptomyces sp. S3(2020)]|uniref:hypothetical protein n=1 Tax=Streptomyces sp. S3(2020) TaxID=2732044 RepID=UPI0014876DC6|nr:hypothetical protein [Streptomyces sp. S3(2020)]NNN32181.1 hypothetical protein [Streptomyces sp. S3(2020)]
MGGAEQELEQQYRQLREKVGERRAEVLKHSPRDDQFAAEYARLVSVTGKLVEFEKALPARLAEPARRLSTRIVRWSWVGQAVVAAALISAVFVWDHSGWWLVLLVPHLAATVAGAFQTVDAVRHWFRRKVAIGLHAVGVLVVLVSLRVISLWFLIAILIGWALLWSAVLDETGTSAKGAKA